jgi:hypothetical protein
VCNFYVINSLFYFTTTWLVIGEIWLKRIFKEAFVVLCETYRIVWLHWVEILKASVTRKGDSVEIRNQHISRASLKYFSYSCLIGPTLLFFTYLRTKSAPNQIYMNWYLLVLGTFWVALYDVVLLNCILGGTVRCCVAELHFGWHCTMYRWTAFWVALYDVSLNCILVGTVRCIAELHFGWHCTMYRWTTFWVALYDVSLNYILVGTVRCIAELHFG